MVNMRKIMKREPKDLGFGFSGHSNETGILIRTEAFEEISLADDFKGYSHDKYPGAFATFLEDGTVVVDTADVKKANAKQEEYDTMDSPRIKKLGKILFISSIVCFLLLIPAGFLNMYFPTLLMSMAFILYGLSRISEFVYAFAMRLLGHERFKQMHRFHYAEHAVINAYYDLRRVPTLEEIKNYSGFSYSCGVAGKIKSVWCFLMVGVCRLAPDSWYFASLLVMLLLTWWWMKNGLYWTEIISLSKPKEIDYQVAIAAMTRALEYKEEIDKMKESISVHIGDGCIAHFVITIGGPEEDT